MNCHVGGIAQLSDIRYLFIDKIYENPSEAGIIDHNLVISNLMAFMTKKKWTVKWRLGLVA